MIRNLLGACDNKILFANASLGRIPLIPRNFPSLPLSAHPYALAPQNAWPWSRKSYALRDLPRLASLRVASEVGMRKASLVLRISSAIPDIGNTGESILHNVLDADFDKVLAEAATTTPVRTGALVCLGSLTRYRNVERLIAGHQYYIQQGGSRPLLIAGSSSDRYGRHLERISRESLGVYTSFSENSRAQFLSLMLNNHGVIFPSVVEASPFTLLEALAINGNLAASNIVGHIELLTANSPAASINTFNPYSSRSVSEALVALEESYGTPDPTLSSPEGRSKNRVKWGEALRNILNSSLVEVQ